MPPDNKNSGQALPQLIAEKANPVADVTYLGGTARRPARPPCWQPYKPQDGKIPAEPKDPDGYWFTIHSGTLGLFVNTAALGGKPVPASAGHLLKPEYKGLVGYLDPTSARGRASSGSWRSILRSAAATTTSTGHQVLQGCREPADRAEADLVRARYLGRDPDPARLRFQRLSRRSTPTRPRCEFVIPKEGTRGFPYVMGLVNGAESRATARRCSTSCFRDESQRHVG